MGLLDLVFGRVEITVLGVCMEDCINLLHRHGVPFRGIRTENGAVSFSVRLSKRRKVAGLLDKSGIKVYSIRGKGLPFFLNRYKGRYGIAVGALVFCALLWISKGYVWQITFSGNENISDIVVEDQLRRAGFGVGSYIADADLYSLCNRFLQQSEDFSFISVNMEGTTAKVELRERKKRDGESYSASNLVAKYDGLIESMTVYTGKTVVEKDGYVKQGDLLVSGFLEKTYGFDIVRSTGSVYAYVTREFEVYLPYSLVEREYTGREAKMITLEFFGREIPICRGKNSDLMLTEGFSDRERLVLFDRIRLPMTLVTETVWEYREAERRLTEDEAKKRAEAEMSRLLTEGLVDSEILERSEIGVAEDEGYRLKCVVYCLTDIALEKEIVTERNN